MLLAQRQSLQNNLDLPFYGAKEHVKSRNTALVLLLCIASLLFYSQMYTIKPLTFTGQKIQPTSIVIRTMPKQEILKKKPEELEKMLVDESEFIIAEAPVEDKPKPKPIEKPKPIQEPKPLQKIEPEPAKMAEEVAIESVASAAPSTMLSTSAQADQQSLLFAALMQELERNKKYPRMARRRGIEGTIGLLITLNNKGVVIDYRLVSEKGAPILKKATLNLGKKLLGFASKMDLGKRAQIRIPINYSLKD